MTREGWYFEEKRFWIFSKVIEVDHLGQKGNGQYFFYINGSCVNGISWKGGEV